MNIRQESVRMQFACGNVAAGTGKAGKSLRFVQVSRVSLVNASPCTGISACKIIPNMVLTKAAKGLESERLPNFETSG